MNFDQLSNDASSGSDDMPIVYPIESECHFLVNDYLYDDYRKTSEYSEHLVKVCNEIFPPFIIPCLDLEEKNDEKHLSNSNNNYFKLKKIKKRGRKKLDTDTNFLKQKRKTHDKTDDDNVLTKIQVHFLKFIINLTNDILKVGFQTKDNNDNNVYFKPINYEDKKKINIENIKKLKSSCIKDILQMKTSSKCRKYGEDYNEKNYKNILEQINSDDSLNWIKKFFDMNYLDVFEKFYYTLKEIKNITFQEKIINFSKKTKSFYDLLSKNESKMKECLITISARYSKRDKQPSQKIFLISKK